MSKTTVAPPADPGETKSLVADGAGDQALCLLISSRGGVSVQALTGREVFVIGRAHEADIFIPDDSISRRHAQLRIGSRLTLEDLGSSNGTTVEERRLRQGEEVLVRVGSVFEVGQTTVVIQRARSLSGETGVPDAPQPRALKDFSASGRVVVDSAMQRLYGLVGLVAPSQLAVLILGETGVGKEVFAEAVHQHSLRANKPFLQLNCASFPESTLEGELFGFEKGAFTGANQAKPGLFESASGGTVFLDEVGEIPLTMQAKLLRVLESGEVMRLGALRPKRVDVRFLSATNRDPRALIAEGRFRADLYYRLNGMTLTLPPLRRRPDDILPLARCFIARVSEGLGRDPPALGAEVAKALESYDWPGNVRELRNVIERAVVTCRGAALETEHLHLTGLTSEEEGAGSDARAAFPLPEAPTAERPSRKLPARALPDDTAQTSRENLGAQIAALEKQSILDALVRTAGNQSKAAKVLGITRRVLINRLDLYGIPRPRKGPEDDK